MTKPATKTTTKPAATATDSTTETPLHTLYVAVASRGHHSVDRPLAGNAAEPALLYAVDGAVPATSIVQGGMDDKAVNRLHSKTMLLALADPRHAPNFICSYDVVREKVAARALFRKATAKEADAMREYVWSDSCVVEVSSRVLNFHATAASAANEMTADSRLVSRAAVVLDMGVALSALPSEVTEAWTQDAASSRTAWRVWAATLGAGSPLLPAEPESAAGDTFTIAS